MMWEGWTLGEMLACLNDCSSITCGRANKVMYSGLEDSDIMPRGVPHTASVAMPTVSSGTTLAEVEVAEVDPVSVLPSNGREDGGGVAEVVGEGLRQLLPDLVTLAMLPRSQWQNLINLDIIKVGHQLPGTFLCQIGSKNRNGWGRR